MAVVRITIEPGIYHFRGIQRQDNGEWSRPPGFYQLICEARDDRTFQSRVVYCCLEPGSRGNRICGLAYWADYFEWHCSVDEWLEQLKQQQPADPAKGE